MSTSLLHTLRDKVGPGASVWNALPRGLALFLGGFSLLNLLGELRTPGFDANLWWIDLHFLPRVLGRAVLFTGAVWLISFAIWSPRSRWRRVVTFASAATLGLAALENVLQFYWLLVRGSLTSHLPMSLSLLVFGALTLIGVAAVRRADARFDGGGTSKFEDADQASRGRLDRQAGSLPHAMFVCLACALAFPILQIFCFGKTDYRRPADVVVVLGARVYADGRPSEALADRVRTACGLYRDGLARKLILSGGPGDGSVHETEAMRRMAMQLGVRSEDVLLDRAGLNTQATVNNTRTLLTGLHASRVLVVSHFYHLPRIKLAYQRAGREVYTVPARESYPFNPHPYNILREVPALWVYYLRTV
jgi:uncharacterized SAM-binding protein YcdF (DUF218 family)